MDEIDNMDLPVMAFMVDWKDGVTERLDWLTDTLPDIRGNEQTRALRLTPRREFDATLTLWGQERQYWDLWLHRMADKEFIFPLWHDSFRMKGFGTFLNLLRFDPVENDVKVGDILMFRGSSSLDFMLVRVVETYTGEEPRVIIEGEWPLTAGNQRWPSNSRLFKVARGRLAAATTATPVTDQASRSKITVECVREQPANANVDGLDIYMGLPVMTVEPNRKESIDQVYEWAFGETDSNTGRRFRKSVMGRPSVRQKQTWWLKGRANKRVFRSFLERQRGAARTVWLPTFNNDMSLSRDIAAGAQSIYCKAFGFAYTGGPSSGREHIAIKTRAGYLYRRVTGTAAALAGEERLTITPALPASLRMVDVLRISWIDTARFENDRFEIDHATTLEGLATCAAIMKTVRDERVAPAILSAPIPASMMSANRCGQPEDPCVPLPVDYAHQFTLRPGDLFCNPQWSGNLNVEWPDYRPNGPTGELFGAFGKSLVGGETRIVQYERFVANDPVLQGQKMLEFVQTDFNNWVLRLYFDPPTTGPRFINLFPAARYCSSGGGPKDENGYGRLEIIHATPANPDGISLGLRVAGGNTDSRWDW
jgi:hypothetical protein